MSERHAPVCLCRDQIIRTPREKTQLQLLLLLGWMPISSVCQLPKRAGNQHVEVRVFKSNITQLTAPERPNHVQVRWLKKKKKAHIKGNCQFVIIFMIDSSVSNL